MIMANVPAQTELHAKLTSSRDAVQMVAQVCRRPARPAGDMGRCQLRKFLKFNVSILFTCSFNFPGFLWATYTWLKEHFCVFNGRHETTTITKSEYFMELFLFTHGYHCLLTKS